MNEPPFLYSWIRPIVVMCVNCAFSDSLSTAIVCNELSAIENGMISYSPDSEGPEYDLGTMATYSCNDGFVLVGPIEVRICEDVGTGALGEFNDEAPTCEREFV